MHVLNTDTLCTVRQAFQAYYETEMLKDSSPSTMCVDPLFQSHIKPVSSLVMQCLQSVDWLMSGALFVSVILNVFTTWNTHIVCSRLPSRAGYRPDVRPRVLQGTLLSCKHPPRRRNVPHCAVQRVLAILALSRDCCRRQSIL